MTMETLKSRNERLAEIMTEARTAEAAAEVEGRSSDASRARDEADSCARQLFEGNVRLVYRYSNRFSNNANEADLEHVEAGKEALLRAIYSWKPSKGSLANWAWPMIKKAVLKEIAQSEHRLKAHAFEQRGRVIEAERALLARLGRHPSDVEIAKESSVAESMVAALRLNEASGKTTSLNTVIGEDGTELGEVAGPSVPSAEDIALGLSVESSGLLSEMTPTDLTSMLKHCDIWEVVVGLRHIGADDGPPQDFQEMVPVLGASRETLRKIYARFAHKIS